MQGALRTPAVVQRFQSVPQVPGQTPPLLQYFGTLLTKGGLNAFESVELARMVLSQNKAQLLQNWFNEDKLECSEELGDMLRQVDPDMALKVRRNRKLAIVLHPDAELPMPSVNRILPIHLIISVFATLIYRCGGAGCYQIFVKAKASPKVIEILAGKGEFDKLSKYSQQVGYTPDYSFLLQRILQTDPQVRAEIYATLKQHD